MNYSFVIRKAVKEDACSIQGILQESFKKYMMDTGLQGTMEALQESIKNIEAAIESQEAYIALIDEVPVGTIRVRLNEDNTAYLSRFGVRLDYHNIGIGKALINLVDKILKTRGVKSVTLHTASKYSELIRFYYGRGFYVRSVSEDRGYLRAFMQKDYM